MQHVRSAAGLLAWLQEQGDVHRELSELRDLLDVVGLSESDVGRSFGALLLDSNWATSEEEDCPGAVTWLHGMVGNDPRAYTATVSGPLLMAGGADASAGWIDSGDEVAWDDEDDDGLACPICGDPGDNLDLLLIHVQRTHYLAVDEAAAILASTQPTPAEVLPPPAFPAGVNPFLPAESNAGATQEEEGLGRRTGPVPGPAPESRPDQNPFL
jgi:hypothetical protein